MKVLRLHGPGDLRLADEPEPALPPGHSLVRITSVGICGSDLQWFAHAGIGDVRVDRPLVLGHEMAGIVEAGPRTGQRVALDPAMSCGACADCRGGNPNLCGRIVFAGHAGQDGGLREKLTWPTQLLHPLAEHLTDADGAMLEPLGVALHAVDLAHLRQGMHVLVVGCGPIGLLIVRLARLAGASTVAALEPLAHRRKAAQRVGAAIAVERADDLPAVLDEVTSGRGADVAFEVTDSGSAPETAMAGVRAGARVVLVGIPDDDRTSFRASLARRKGLTLVFVRRMKASYPRAIGLLEQGTVDAASLVSGRYPFERAGEAFEVAARREGLKIVVEPTQPEVR